MRISEIAALLDAAVLTGKNLDRLVTSACGADLMSDVLAYVKSDSVLLTGLVNQHVVRTAEMLDIACIVFVRGKTPPEDLCALAEEKDIAVMTTGFSLYDACGRLYQKGMPSCMPQNAAHERA